jgi:phosphatidylglycerophosphate synthase
MVKLVHPNYLKGPNYEKGFSQRIAGAFMFTLASLPNCMTVIRIVITPLIAVLIWSDVAPYYYQLALYLYTIASITDYVDGYIARRLKV